MPHELPCRERAPVRLASIRGKTSSVSKPGPGKPISCTNVSIGVRDVQSHDDDARHDNPRNTDKLYEDKKDVEPRTRLGADGVGYIHYNEYKNGQQLMSHRVSLVRHTRGGEDTLNKDYAENG